MFLLVTGRHIGGPQWRLHTKFHQVAGNALANRERNHDDDGNENENSLARFALAVFIFLHFADVLVLSTT